VSTFLITGSAGFFGGLLKRRLLAEGASCVGLDLQPDEDRHANLTAVQGDVRDRDLLVRLGRQHRFDAVFHCAAMLAHAVKDERLLWTSNVDGTRAVADACRELGVRKLVFTSTNCLWAKNFGRPVTEEDAPDPVEIYGRSKWEAEKILKAYAADLDVVTLRTPTITDAGRLGLLAILFEFIDEDRKVWVVGGGRNAYQFIYAQDLATACIAGLRYGGSRVFNVGSDGVKPMRDVYQAVIRRAGSKSRVASLPKGPAIAAMKVAHALRISPLGPYQYRMIAEDFVFDTSRAKRELGWAPTLNNEEMLFRAYDYYRQNRRDIEARTGVSAHRQAAPMGVIRLLKWLS
jgi:nucleoside-diphosphate-sugar epimerase